MNKTLISLFFVLANLPTPVSACNILTVGLKDKMDEYRDFKSANQETLVRLERAAADCRTKGESLAEKAAQAASGLSCMAQGDAHRVNQEISEVGVSCELTFNELHSLQESLRSRFAESKADLDEGTEEFKESEDLMALCSEEFKVAEQMAKNFSKLEGSILETKSSAVAGRQDYLKLKETGASLAAQTAALSKSCGEQAPANGTPAPNRMIASTHGQGSAVVVPSGNSPRPVSDISGTKKAIDDNAKAEAVINRNP